MRKLFILIFLLITINGYCGFLGEYEQGEDIYLFTQFNTTTGAAATDVTATNCAIWDSGDASTPTASGSLVEWDSINAPGLYRFRYTYAYGLLASGPCVARLTGTVGTNGVRPAGIHTFFVVDSGRGPNARSILTEDSNIGIDWGDIDNKGSTVDLSATDIQLADTTTDVTNAVTTDNTNVLTEIEGLQQTQSTMYATLETVSNGVTVTTNNDKTGYSLLDSSGNQNVIAAAMRTVDAASGETVYGSVLERITQDDATLSTVNTNVNIINTNTDGDGSGGIDADIDTIAGYTDTLEASMSTVNKKQDKAQASLNTVIGYADVLPSTAPVSWNDTNDPDDIYTWITNDANVTQDSELASVGLTDNSANRTVIVGAMRGMDASTVSSVEGSLIDKIDDIGSSVSTISAGTTLSDNQTNRLTIAGAMRNTDAATTEAVRGSIVQKIDDGMATEQLVWASIETIRGEHSIITDEIRKNR